MKPLKLLAVLAAVCCMCPALPAGAQEISEPAAAGLIVVEEESGPVLRDVITQGNQIVKVYDAPPGYSSELLKEPDFEKQGIRYHTETVLQVRENRKEESKLAAQTVTVSHENKEAIPLSPILDYELDGYSGQLQLDYNSLSTVAAGNSRYSYTVTDTREISGLARNDTYAIPKTAQKNGVSLTLTDVAWTSMGDSYTALATYTGTGYGTHTTGYTTTASYVGEVRRETLESVTWQVIYEGEPVPGNHLGVYIFLGAAVILAGGAVCLMIRNRRRHIAEQGKESRN